MHLRILQPRFRFGLRIAEPAARIGIAVELHADAVRKIDEIATTGHRRITAEGKQNEGEVIEVGILGRARAVGCDCMHETAIGAPAGAEEAFETMRGGFKAETPRRHHVPEAERVDEAPGDHRAEALLGPRPPVLPG